MMPNVYTFDIVSAFSIENMRENCVLSSHPNFQL
jgi:hypothetical protein